MQVVYEEFRLPKRISSLVDDNNKSVYIAEPFEKGFGHTVGNALRRVLLTSIESYAIVALRFEGVSHEYTAIDGVIEDMTSIIINFKGVLLRKIPVEGHPFPRGVKKVAVMLNITNEMIQEGNGNYTVQVKDLFADSEFDVINPHHKLFTVTQPMSRLIEFKVALGRGYCPSERIHLAENNFSEIIIDAAFSPVRHVNYYVEGCRVGGETDLDRLIVEVTTDGRITPDEAMTHAVQILSLHLNVFDPLKMHQITFDNNETEDSSDRDAIMSKLALKISEIELSVRSTNCLHGANISTIAELVSKSEQEMLKFRNFGKKSLNEIKAKLEEMGLSLGMDLSKYGIDPDHIKEYFGGTDVTAFGEDFEDEDFEDDSLEDEELESDEEETEEEETEEEEDEDEA
ncbi:MAG: DNA-directed RNA polymerase subunit alpha [Chlamydiia bacterium]